MSTWVFVEGTCSRDTLRRHEQLILFSIKCFSFEPRLYGGTASSTFVVEPTHPNTEEIGNGKAT